jgi:hypothetical protein
MVDGDVGVVATNEPLRIIRPAIGALALFVDRHDSELREIAGAWRLEFIPRPDQRVGCDLLLEAIFLIRIFAYFWRKLADRTNCRILPA